MIHPDSGRRAMLVALAALPFAASATATTRIDLPDARLRNQAGRELKLRTDVLRDQVAVVNFVFTNCKSFCSAQSALIADLQQRQTRRLGSELILASITVDPLTDDPARLRNFSAPFAPGPHWHWLTGEPTAVFAVLEAFQASSKQPTDHSAMLLVGRGTRWVRMLGMPAPASVEAVIQRLSSGV
jgi:protein SCO1/2